MELELASESDLKFIRIWAGCPEDFASTAPEVASGVHRKLFDVGLSIEASQILGYLRGELPLLAKHFEMIQDAYMCDSSENRDEVRRKYRERQAMLRSS